MKLRAQEWSEMLLSGEAPSKAELARKEGVSRAYVTKVLYLFDKHT